MRLSQQAAALAVFILYILYILFMIIPIVCIAMTINNANKKTGSLNRFFIAWR